MLGFVLYSNQQDRTLQTNLNKTEFPNWDPGYGYYPKTLDGLPHRLEPVTVGSTTLIFADHDQHLCREIRRWPAVVGCMAWLTNRDVLAALQGRAVSILVQKEDWLRPDTGGYTQAEHRELYSCLSTRGMERELAGFHLCTHGTLEELGGVMCAGMCSQDKVSPRMHHKFMVFGEIEKPDREYGKFIPRAVWTGSFNATYNGTNSLENAVLIRDAAAAAVYHEEWKALLGLAEPLDWEHKWVQPIFRVGT